MNDDRVTTKTVYVTPSGNEFESKEAALRYLQIEDVIAKCNCTPGVQYSARELIGRILHYYDLKARP